MLRQKTSRASQLLYKLQTAKQSPPLEHLPFIVSLWIQDIVDRRVWVDFNWRRGLELEDWRGGLFGSIMAMWSRPVVSFRMDDTDHRPISLISMMAEIDDCDNGGVGIHYGGWLLCVVRDTYSSYQCAIPIAIRMLWNEYTLIAKPRLQLTVLLFSQTTTTPPQSQSLTFGAYVCDG